MKPENWLFWINFEFGKRHDFGVNVCFSSPSISRLTKHRFERIYSLLWHFNRSMNSLNLSWLFDIDKILFLRFFFLFFRFALIYISKHIHWQRDSLNGWKTLYELRVYKKHHCARLSTFTAHVFVYRYRGA